MNKKDKKSRLKLDHINSWQNLWIIHGNSCSQKNSKMQSLRIERFYNQQGNETKIVVMKVGSNNNAICRHL